MVAIHELNIKAIQGCLCSPHLTVKLHGSRFMLRLALCRIKRDVPGRKSIGIMVLLATVLWHWNFPDAYASR